MFTIEHYRKFALNYDRFQQVQSRAVANFIQKHLQLSIDQIIDVGGGTAQISLMIKEDFNLTKSVVSIDPSQEMLNVAMKNGAITIESTAEDFFATEPNFPLNVIFMNSCIHHFENLDFVFSKMASYMPEDGMCIVCKYPPNTTLPFFKAAKDAYMKAGDKLEEAYKHIDFESKGLTCRKVAGVEKVIMEKMLWYEGIRNRLATFMVTFSDEELEEGIKELEKDFKGQETIKLDITIKALILTKQTTR